MEIAGYIAAALTGVLVITAIAVTGIFTGSALAAGTSAEKLKKYFGWFVLLTGIFILIREIIIQ